MDVAPTKQLGVYLEDKEPQSAAEEGERRHTARGREERCAEAPQLARRLLLPRVTRHLPFSRSMQSSSRHQMTILALHRKLLPRGKRRGRDETMPYETMLYETMRY